MTEVIGPHMADITAARERVASFLCHIDKRNNVDTSEVAASIAEAATRKSQERSEIQRIQALTAVVLEGQLQTDILAL